jgi:hypothetical protein
MGEGVQEVTKNSEDDEQAARYLKNQISNREGDCPEKFI